MLFKDDVLVEEGQLDQNGTLIFKHELDSGCAYRLELANGQMFNIHPTAELSLDKTSSVMGFHGYVNPGGSLTEESPELEEDRVLSNPFIPTWLGSSDGESYERE